MLDTVVKRVVLLRYIDKELVSPKVDSSTVQLSMTDFKKRKQKEGLNEISSDEDMVIGGHLVTANC